MKRLVALFLIVLLTCVSYALAEESREADWAVAPEFIKAYEQSSGNIYVEWEGNAPLYQVYVDGEKKSDVAVSHALLSVSKGSHTVMVYPIYEEKAEGNSKIGVNLGLPQILGSKESGFHLDLDLSALGLNAKSLIPGTPSAPLSIDYKPDPVFTGSATDLSVSTDSANRVVLSFSDQFNADEYELTIAKGMNSNYVIYKTDRQADSALVTKSNSLVSIILDPAFLAEQDCPALEPDGEYKFSVLVRKYALDYISGEKDRTVIHSSAQSKAVSYVPTEPWKTAPVITYASQTADGQITLRWSHDDSGSGCAYQIIQISKKFGIKTKETKLATVEDNEFVFNDLVNGKYTFAVAPEYLGKRGSLSSSVTIEVKNGWVVAPSLICKQTAPDEVRLLLAGSDKIDHYCFTVYSGDSRSLLRFVNLDYKEHDAFTVPAESPEMEYLYKYDQAYDSEKGVKLKFEVYGVHIAADGKEQKTAVTTETIVLH